MKIALSQDHTSLTHPLDVIEDVALSREWTYERSEPDELLIEIPGRWCVYRLFASWREDINTMHIACSYDLRISHEKRPDIYELLALINERLWLGHFDLTSEDDSILFRYTLLLSSTTKVQEELIQEVLDVALMECDRFYPALQFVLWGGKTAQEASVAAMLETVGEA